MTEIAHPDPGAPPGTPLPPRGARLREVAGLFLRLGFTAFGGPPAHVAMMEDEVVRRRKWLDRQHFLDLVSAINFIPGPNSTELAIHLGYVRAGLPGLLVAGVCFIVPAVLIILPVAWAYTRYGSVPQVRPVLLAVNAAVLAILAAAFWRLLTAAVRDRFTLVVAALAAVLGLAPWLPAKWQPELIILAAAALAGALWYGRPRLSPASVPLLAVAAFDPAPLGRLFLAMLKIGATLYGSGYLLVTYLRATMVEQHAWLTERELLDAVSVGQITPGPLLTTATFVGYLVGQRNWGDTTGGIVGGILATAGIFLPSFVLVAVLGPAMDRLRRNRFARGALDGMNAAVASLILVVTLQLAAATLGRPTPSPPAFGLDPLLVAITAVAAFVLLRFNLNATWIVAGAALVGVARILFA